MSEFMFLVLKGVRLTKKQRVAIERIAREHDAEFQYVEGRQFDSSGKLGWFTAPNMGDPFDSARRDAVRTALQKAGLLKLWA
jgi:hypothetical protein